MATDQNYCVKINTTALPFDVAQQACVEKKLSLATVISESQQAFVTEQVRQVRCFLPHCDLVGLLFTALTPRRRPPPPAGILSWSPKLGVMTRQGLHVDIGRRCVKDVQVPAIAFSLQKHTEVASVETGGQTIMCMHLDVSTTLVLLYP
ncbi:unnamed protein product [Dibothriocephalus latus]|uniref:C-type lectin domain-containing protein n=1 Tax=Dibothriocephalus latus TaxID=60516 RepID=A0A3P6Q9G8_DIBLA|nr:unnamed protein product [Dibothriocephalus latus]